VLATGVLSYPSVCHLFSFYFQVIFNLHKPNHEAQIYFVFLSVGNPKTGLKGGYTGWIGGSSFAVLGFCGACGKTANVLTLVNRHIFFKKSLFDR